MSTNRKPVTIAVDAYLRRYGFREEIQRSDIKAALEPLHGTGPRVPNPGTKKSLNGVCSTGNKLTHDIGERLRALRKKGLVELTPETVRVINRDWYDGRNYRKRMETTVHPVVDTELEYDILEADDVVMHDSGAASFIVGKTIVRIYAPGTWQEIREITFADEDSDV